MGYAEVVVSVECGIDRLCSSIANVLGQAITFSSKNLVLFLGDINTAQWHIHRTTQVTSKITFLDIQNISDC